MSITNCTVKGYLFTGTSDSADVGSDADEVLLRGSVHLTLVTEDRRPLLAPGNSPPAVIPQPVRFTGQVVDGELEPMRVWANDGFGIDHLFYRVDFDLSTAAGNRLKVDPGYFEAPLSDVEIDLSEVLQTTGAVSRGSLKLYGPNGVRLVEEEIVFTFDGRDIADPIPFAYADFAPIDGGTPESSTTDIINGGNA